MKTLGGATLVGVLVALLVIYWLGSLNGGAVALVLILCVSAANLVAGAVVAVRKRAEEPGRPARKKKKKRSHRSKITPLMLLLVGCASVTSGRLHPVSPLSLRVPTRGILLHDQRPPAGFGAYGYVLFTARPDAASRPRYLAICQEYQSSLEPTMEFSDVPPDRLMVTFWLLSSAPAASTCEALIESYDYARATVIAKTLGRLGSRGPILVAWKAPFKFGVAQTGEALVVDMSDFTSEADISEAFRIWRDRISQDPENWSHGFNLALIRLELQSFLNTYGQQVVAFIGGGSH